ncbi:peroxisome proliferator-activated receptor gamma coactivator 1-beta isoform X2 [Pleurodeles waltl]|uniref:peroxisome proliferator-activated receptor gamma coactivator 1-beta isoform X2 n=1 Tax=Pleurodeles waltl TaxID=8319 RepID=UPI0037094675
MAECGAELDEALSSFVFSYLEESENQVPDEEALSLDFSEIDLLQLDTGDFDSSSYFDELPWGSAPPGTKSSLYNNDESDLFKIIDSENEALLAALTQTLDDIQEDDLGLSAFAATCDGGFLAPPTSPLSPASYAAVAESPPPSEADEDELSIAEISRERTSTKSYGHGRSCTELHKHLVTPQHTPQSVREESHNTNERVSQACSNDSGDGGSSDGEPMLPQGAIETQQSPLCEVDPQFISEKEQQAMVGLIQYMHTYCLPLRKLSAQDSHGKSRHDGSVVKKAKMTSPPQKPVISSKATFNLVSSTKCRPKRHCSENSILRKLLAQNVASDVSKPYRLVQPTYASLISPTRCKSPTAVKQEVENNWMCAPKAKIQPPVKTALKVCPLGQNKAGNTARDLRRPSLVRHESASTKVAPKPESTIHAVRRSGRLNPELGQWLSFTEDELNKALCEVESGLGAVAGAASVKSEVENLELSKQVLRPLRAETDLGSTLPSPESDSIYTKKAFDPGVTVELCGTAGLTPPTTPPYKPADDDLFKPDIECRLVKDKVPNIPSPTGEGTETSLEISGKSCRRQPERTELFAHLSRSSGRPCWKEHQSTKRPLSRSFGDHDYCQVVRSEVWSQRKVLNSWEPPSKLATKHLSLASVPPKRRLSGDSTDGIQLQESHTEDENQLRDLEIRASLTKHFGFLDQALEDVNIMPCLSPSNDTVFEDSGSESDGSQAGDTCSRSPFQSTQCPHRSSPTRTVSHLRYRSLSGSRSSCRSRSPANSRNLRCETNEQDWKQSHWHVQRSRQRAIDEGRLVYIRNLSSSMSSCELKKRFEVFGEITECRVLSRNNKAGKYGFVTFRCPENAALSMKNGASLRKRQEPAFQLSYGGLRHFWTRYTDLDSNMEDMSPSAAMKSKYETMDFDSLLKEAQRSLQR